MIHSSDLSPEANRFADLLEQAGDHAKSEIKEDLNKIAENIYEKMYETMDLWFASNIRDNFLQTVAYEVSGIIRDLLSGNIDAIKKCYITSEYTFDNLHNIRLAIWKAAAVEVEYSIIKEQANQIAKLRMDVEHYKRDRY